MDLLNIIGTGTILKDNQMGFKLIKKMLDDNIVLIEPVVDIQSDKGFSYPRMESFLHLSTDGVVDLLEDLANTGIINARLFDKLSGCPQCGSCRVESVEGCPRCGGIKIERGRILEHLKCGHLGLEDEYMVTSKNVCPKCKMELKYLFTDYQSVGVKYKCTTCSHIFDSTTPMMKCHKCTNLFIKEHAREVFVSAYELSEEQRHWLQFEIGPRERLIKFLQSRSYEVIEQARVSGISKSGAEHYFNLVARKNNGFIDYMVCIDIEMNSKGTDVGLDEVFKFDNKAYDLGIQSKVLLAVPRLEEKARQFAQRQQIKVYEGDDLEKFLDTVSAQGTGKTSHVTIKMENDINTREKLISLLTDSGYLIQEKARVKGRSGVEHVIDILATIDDGFIAHMIDIGVLKSDSEVGLDTVFLFDTRAFDAGIRNKILLVTPGLTPEARKFAEHQRIKVIETSWS